MFYQNDKNPLLSGITLTGGEPLVRAEELLPFVEAVRARGKNIVAFTGYTFEELLKLQEAELSLKKLLPMIDILIDGRFELAEKDLRLSFRGSHNQRILDLPASLASGSPVLLEEYM